MTSIISKTRLKPPSFLVFCGDKKDLFTEIRMVLREILPIDTYTIAELSKRALIEHPWMQYCACLLIADTTGLDSSSCARFNDYFLRNPSKILFINEQEQLTTSIANGKHAELFKNVFGNGTKINKLFEGLELKTLINKKEIQETFAQNHCPEVGPFCIELHKRNDQPPFFHLHHPTHEKKMIMSDASINELLKSKSSEHPPIQELLTRLGLETIQTKNGPQSQQPELTPGFLFNHPDTAVLNMTGMTYGKEVGTKPKLLFCPTANLLSENGKIFADANPNFLPIEVRRMKDGIPTGCIRKFNVEKYYGHLNAQHFGRALLFVPVCTSTMDVSESISNAFPLLDGTLVVAGHQTAGRGRIGNEWLCAEGAAMFNVNLNVPYNSQLGQSICLLQHLMAVSICHAISELAPEFPIKIKWPNDLYFSRLGKLGGVLVRTSQNEAEQKYSCLIGVGLNVANSKPTVCINDMLPEGARKLEIEEVLALVMNKFESHLANFQKNGKADLVRDYYKFWLHTDEEVSILRTEDGQHEKVVIRGLDDDGYLLVRSKETARHISIQSDGNSFDLFQGLIIPKSM